MASLREVREAVAAVGGRLEHDSGDWEMIAPHGKRWKESESVWWHVTLTSCTCPREHQDELARALKVARGGVEDVPRENADAWRAPFVRWVESVAGQPGWGVQPLPKSLRDSLVAEGRLADHWILAYPQHAMIFRAGWEAAEDVITY